MSKYQTTQYNHFNICKRNLYNMHRTVENFQCNFNEFLQHKNIHYKNIEYSYSKLNNWYRGKLSGIEDALYYKIESQLQWCHFVEVNDNIIKYKYEDMPEKLRPFARSSHFWKNSDKMWSESIKTQY